MKSIKRIIVLVLCLAMVLGCVSAFADSEAHKIRLRRPDHGTVKTNTGTAKLRDTVKVYVTPEEGYEVDKVAIQFSKTISATWNDSMKCYFFVMPNEDVIIKVTFLSTNPAEEPKEEPAEEPKEEEPAEESKEEPKEEEPAEETKPAEFPDVPSWRYYYEPIQWALEKEITTGKEGGIFDPNGTTTRAEMVTFLWRNAGCPVVNYAMTFEDVLKDSYYEEAVRWACSEGITTGYSDTEFSPYKPVTRGEAVTFISRVAGIDPSIERSHTFSDVRNWKFYNNPIAWATANGIATGFDRWTFQPQSNCSRAQVITFIYRLENEYNPELPDPAEQTENIEAEEETAAY